MHRLQKWTSDMMTTSSPPLLFTVYGLKLLSMFWCFEHYHSIISYPIFVRHDRINHTLVDMNSWHNDYITITFTVNWFSYTFHNSGGKLSWILTKLVFRNVYRSLVTAQCYFSRFSEYHHFSWVICLKSHYLVITSPCSRLSIFTFSVTLMINILNWWWVLVCK